MRKNYSKISLYVATWAASILIILTPVLIPFEYADAGAKKNKCKIVCKHRNNKGRCLIRGEDCSGKKVKKASAVTPDKDNDNKKDKKKNKNICQKKSTPKKSKTKGKHMDEDCCPDPDEWANPKCEYSVRGYSVMIPNPK